MSSQISLSSSGISCHAWNGDKTSKISIIAQKYPPHYPPPRLSIFLQKLGLAICPNDRTVRIFETATWKELYILDEV